MSDIQFVEIDAQQINNNLITDFETALGETLYPGDERRIFLNQETQVIVGLKNNINETGRQNLLRYATGNVLDAMGERVNTPRLQAQKAKTTLRFTLSQAQISDVIIEQGKRATPDGKLYFITTSYLTIPAGQLYGDVLSEAAEGGEQYNSFAPGQIKTLVDPTPYVTSVQNIDVSSGGSDIESDDDGINVWSGYRERIRQAPSSFSTAGPEDAYKYWAKTANVDIQDVSVTSPGEGQIKITILMKDGELPNQNILNSVLSVCSDKKVRPLTDQVIVSSPTVVNYNINLTYYISNHRATDEVSIRNSIEGDNGAIEQYNAWQSAALGREINPDYLRQLMLVSGAYKIDLTSPAYATINEDAVVKVGTITVNYGGLI